MSAPLQEGISSVLRRSSSPQNLGVFSNLPFAKIQNCYIFRIVLGGMSSYEIIKHFAKRLFYHDVFVALQPLKEMSNVLRKSTSSLFLSRSQLFWTDGWKKVFLTGVLSQD